MAAARWLHREMTAGFHAATSVDLDASAERVWRVLVDPDLVARYMYGTSVETDWQVGSRIVWRG